MDLDQIDAKLWFFDSGQEHVKAVPQQAHAGNSKGDLEAQGPPGITVSVKRSSQPNGRTGLDVWVRVPGWDEASADYARELAIKEYARGLEDMANLPVLVA